MLHIHYSPATFTQHMHYSHATYALQSRYICTTVTLHMHYSHATYALQLRYICTTVTLHMHYSYATYALQSRYICTTVTLHMHYSHATYATTVMLQTDHREIIFYSIVGNSPPGDPCSGMKANRCKPLCPHQLNSSSLASFQNPPNSYSLTRNRLSVAVLWHRL